MSTPDDPRAVSTPDDPRAVSTPDDPRATSTPDPRAPRDPLSVLREDPAGTIARWLAAYDASPLRPPRPRGAPDVRSLAEAIAVALTTVDGEADLVPGSSALREAEKRFVFAGGALGADGAHAPDVVAFVLALRDTLVAAGSGGPRLPALFDWFVALAAEGHAVSAIEAIVARQRETLERATPVVLVAPEVPACLLVGAPDRWALQGIFSRLVVAVARTGADRIVLDAGGLEAPVAPDVLAALAELAGHEVVRGRVGVTIARLPGEDEPAWRAALAPLAVTFAEDFHLAVAAAVEEQGHSRRASP